MTVEEQLKNLILKKYHSIRAFTVEHGIAYSTMDSALKRGILNTSVSTIQKICDALGISMEDIADGVLFNNNNEMPERVTEDEYELLLKYRVLSETSKSLIVDFADLVLKRESR